MKKSNRRKVNGILLLDKPIGFSSNAILQQVKYLYFAAKAGHTGSLDPLATGMLPICFGEATKFSQYLLDADKSYYVKAKFGVRTATSDAEGEVVATKPVPDLTLAQIDTACDQFRGRVTQIPSMYSALKYQGKPLYYYARNGIEVPRKERTISVYQLDVLDYQDEVLTFSVKCSKGTYIRTIADDLGELLGCGAHVIELRRTQVGVYNEVDMITLPVLEKLKEAEKFETMDAFLLPVDTAVESWPAIQLNADLVHYLKQGSPVHVPNLPENCQWLRLQTEEGIFFGVGERQDDGRVAPKRLVDTRS
ncbi:MAG: tRNA pseudouridine(55) synthase TruB [Coxiella sp. (in: Bacteria)]|nr:MAG: tRNA pseudouridine(55) synthase TruB [Coxiella sp. (in: g-proteobacteria)]